MWQRDEETNQSDWDSREKQQCLKNIDTPEKHFFIVDKNSWTSQLTYGMIRN